MPNKKQTAGVITTKAGAVPFYQKAGDLKGAARKSAAAAVESHLGATQTLPEFLATAGTLTPGQRRTIVDQALVMIEQVYVHLGLKRAMHAIDPIQRLKLLKLRLATYSERDFHDEMISIYVHMRDLHTNYILPDPYNSRVAALPFRIEEFVEAGKRQYIVTEVSPAFTDPQFKRGVVPTHWNGIPIDRAVELNAEREAGSNLAARHAQGLESLTNRWMGMSLPPDEEWVIIRYLDGSTVRESKFVWQVFEPGTPESGVDPMSAKGPLAARLGINIKSEMQRRARKLLFAPQAIEAERRMARRSAAESVAADLNTESILPDAIPSFRNVDTESGTYGYIRVTTFDVDDEVFLPEVVRIVSLLSKSGLIVDVRGNGGGNIWAGERLLQILTPRQIEPEQFSFVNSPLVLQLCEADQFLKPWAESVKSSTEIGSAYSQGLPLTPPEICNSTGQKYQGPVVLITDAQCYSTTDIFAAGFQDHNIGTIIGTGERTGAGGANVWTHEDLRSTLTGADSPFKKLPGGTTFRVALRRASRVGPRAGVLLEDLGVTPDKNYQMTKNDVMNSNADLIEFAAKLLKAKKGGSSLALTPNGVPAPGTPLSLNATTSNLDRVDIFVDDRPRMTLDVVNGTKAFQLESLPAQFRVVGLGYLKNVLAAAVRLSSEDLA